MMNIPCACLKKDRPSVPVDLRGDAGDLSAVVLQVGLVGDGVVLAPRVVLSIVALRLRAEVDVGALRLLPANPGRRVAVQGGAANLKRGTEE